MAIQTVENENGNIVKIYRDKHAESPLRPHDTVKLALKHSRYDLGHDLDAVEDAGSLTELRSLIEERHDVVHMEKVHLYDHSMLRVKTGSFNGPAQGYARFDSGPVGYAFITESDVSEGYSDERVKDMVESGVELYDQFLRGDVWRCEVVDEGSEEVLDSCSQFYRMESLKEFAGVAEDVEVAL